MVCLIDPASVITGGGTGYPGRRGYRRRFSHHAGLRVRTKQVCALSEADCSALNGLPGKRDFPSPGAAVA